MIRINLNGKYFFFILILIALIGNTFGAMTMKQLINSMDMMRSVCAPKFKVSPETLDGVRKGVLPDDREVKCYMACIAQMAGTVTKKKELSLEKTLNQMEVMAPPELKDAAIEAILACKEVQGQHKDLCDKAYYSTKCAQEYNPAQFMFP